MYPIFSFMRQIWLLSFNNAIAFIAYFTRFDPISLASYADPLAQFVYQLPPLGTLGHGSGCSCPCGRSIFVTPALRSGCRLIVVVTPSSTTQWLKLYNSLCQYTCACKRDCIVVAASLSFQLCHLTLVMSFPSNHRLHTYSRHASVITSPLQLSHITLVMPSSSRLHHHTCVMIVIFTPLSSCMLHYTVVSTYLFVV